MTDLELRNLTLADAARLISRKEISPVELTEAVLDRIGRLNERMRAFITVTEDDALERAKAADKEIAGGHKPPLQGVPVSVKDLYDTKGIRTTAGSKVFENRVPEADAALVTKLKAAGAVLIGKTNLHEFAFGVTSINPHYGTSRNPWDPERITGGSSGGSAGAVALGMGFGSLGTDTGGSIRIPASLCGIVGLKPTYGLTSVTGVFPLSWSLDHAGPMARTVEDTAILLDAITGQKARAREALTGDIRNIRVGIPKTHFYERLEAEVGSALKAALRNLEKLGARVVEVDISSAPRQFEIFPQIASPEVYCVHEQYLKAHGDLYGADVRARIEAGGAMRSIDYVKAQRARLAMRAEFEAAFDIADVIITPTVPIVPPRIDSEIAADSLNRLTRPWNIVGLPAISIPCGFTSGGLPVGMQIAGKALDESTVLRVAHAYEQDARWFERRPGI